MLLQSLRLKEYTEGKGVIGSVVERREPTKMRPTLGKGFLFT
jgi:hypothetical protein